MLKQENNMNQEPKKLEVTKTQEKKQEKPVEQKTS